MIKLIIKISKMKPKNFAMLCGSILSVGVPFGLSPVVPCMFFAAYIMLSDKSKGKD